MGRLLAVSVLAAALLLSGCTGADEGEDGVSAGSRWESVAAATRAAGGADFTWSSNITRGPEHRSTVGSGTVSWGPYAAQWVTRPVGAWAAEVAKQSGLTLEESAEKSVGEVRVVDGLVYRLMGGRDGTWQIIRLDPPEQTPGWSHDLGSPEWMLTRLSVEPWVWDVAADGRLHGVFDGSPTYVGEAWVTVDGEGRASRISVRDTGHQTWGETVMEWEMVLSGWGRKPAPEPVPGATWV